MQATIASNRVQSRSNGIVVGPVFGAGSTMAGDLVGTIHDNRVVGSSAAIVVETTGNSNLEIYSNQITGSNNVGIVLELSAATTALNAVIVSNAVVSNGCDAGIYFQQESNQSFTSNIQLLNNTIANCGSGAVINMYNSAGHVVNNIISGSTTTGLYIPSGMTNDHNLVYGNGDNSYTPGPHTITDDPRFSPGGARLSAGSNVRRTSPTSARSNSAITD